MSVAGVRGDCLGQTRQGDLPGFPEVVTESAAGVTRGDTAANLIDL